MPRSPPPQHDELFKNQSRAGQAFWFRVSATALQMATIIVILSTSDVSGPKILSAPWKTALDNLAQPTSYSHTPWRRRGTGTGRSCGLVLVRGRLLMIRYRVASHQVVVSLHDLARSLVVVVVFAKLPKPFRQARHHSQDPETKSPHISVIPAPDCPPAQVAA